MQAAPLLPPSHGPHHEPHQHASMIAATTQSPSNTPLLQVPSRANHMPKGRKHHCCHRAATCKHHHRRHHGVEQNTGHAKGANNHAVSCCCHVQSHANITTAAIQMLSKHRRADITAIAAMQSHANVAATAKQSHANIAIAAITQLQLQAAQITYHANKHKHDRSCHANTCKQHHCCHHRAEQIAGHAERCKLHCCCHATTCKHPHSCHHRTDQPNQCTHHCGCRCQCSHKQTSPLFPSPHWPNHKPRKQMQTSLLPPCSHL